MFYSSQTGEIHASNLQKLACNQVKLEELAKDNDTTRPCFWLDVSQATERELHKLGEMFDLHPLTLEDIEQKCSRDKIDRFGDYLFISDEEVSQGHSQIFIIMKRNCVLTFHSGSIDMSSESDDPLAKLVDYPAYIVYAILDQVTDQLSPEIAELEQQVDAIDELVLILTHAEHESVLQQMGEQRRRILQTWHLTQPKIEVIALLAKLLSNDSRTTLQGSRSAILQQMSGFLAAEVVQYLGDVHEHLLAGIDACARAETVLARSHSNYLAKISLELSRATYDANSITERWTMLGMIVVPINILTSFLGVNLKIPGQDRDDTLNFFVVLACMLIYAGVTLAFWRWRRIV
ncbi:hypothetical protein COEREDRAFT_37305 [Coemansia reversa NRRL 1564]|uniref:Mg2+ transporter protein n=1 Tax=Coemansia reversa (strain ATCC 12441 / NRRL 1564) TaxID=763665 RepID=A0A2G5BJB6_COERN|nr:hypothetical protein COEREDRAFT_37305 [Coemansia reversa NRRL 1564]|eukprot:PIA19105.1 hypothetical protein COEREDRAFT_37305 [Coemansia reversa NRRL 1564]